MNLPNRTQIAFLFTLLGLFSIEFFLPTRTMAQLPALVNSPTNNQQAVPPTEAIPASMEPQKTGNASPEVDPMNRLKSGDRIRLVVTGFPDFSGEQVILADGTLQLPLVGSIVVAGLSPADAVTTITTSLRPYIRRPQVGLAVVSIRPPRISVTGEVVRPGPRLLTPPPNAFNPNAATENFQTLSFALVQAGGVTPNADLRNIIIRRVISGSTDLGLQTTVPKSEIKVDLWQAIQRGDLSGDPRLVDGDEVIVPTAPVARSEQRQLLSSTVAPLAITVQIAGEVRRPGTVQISPTAGASAAVAAAGGPTDKARTDSMTLLRVSEDGRLERQEFAFGNNTVQLKDGDVIVVDKSFFSSTLETLSNIINPLTPFLFLFGR